jgi:hypothetical protein
MRIADARLIGKLRSARVQRFLSLSPSRALPPSDRVVSAFNWAQVPLAARATMYDLFFDAFKCLRALQCHTCFTRQFRMRKSYS